MTEAEWLAAADPIPLLEFIWVHRPRAYGVYDPARVPVRQLTLFKVACCRAVWLYLSIPSKEAVEVLERFVEGAASELEFTSGVFYQATQGGARDGMILRGLAHRNGSMYLADELAAALQVSAECAEVDLRSQSVKRLARQAAFARDIFRNPFRPTNLQPTWLTPIVVALARQMYESRDFSPMPILADALQDAGCEEEAVLDHCRGEGPHIRGCWVVDLVLGKA